MENVCPVWIESKERIREILKELYSVLKGIDKYLKFVFITGISKFAKVSLFWGRGPGLWIKSVE